MKKVIVSLIILFISLSAFSKELRVMGYGPSVESAKQNAFKNAVEFTVGAVVLGERESENARLVRDEIVVYSSGYIDKFNIVDQSYENGQYRITMDVVVSDSKIAQRLLGGGRDVKDFDGNRHSTQLSTLLEQKQQAQKLLMTVLNDYPTRAYVAVQSAHYIDFNSYNTGFLNVPYELKFNYPYINALSEALGVLSDGEATLLSKPPGNVTIMVKDPNDWFVGKKSIHYFNDLTKVRQVSDHLHFNEPRIQVLLKNGSTPIMGYCYNPKFTYGEGSFYNNGERNSVLIFGNKVEKGVIKLPLDKELYAIINQISSIELRIISRKNC